MTTWQLLIAGALLLTAAVEAYWARVGVAKANKRLEVMHSQLLKLLHKQGVDPLE